MTKIESVDLFYLALPHIEDKGDGSQDALLVRVQAGDHCGWGECEASPLVTMAAWNCPMSHSACKPLSASVLGQRLESSDDILRIHQCVREQSFDLLQTDHLLSGIDMALWDLLGKQRGSPVYELLGAKRSHPKLPYASQLFGETSQDTYRKAVEVARQGYRAAKFGWGSFGKHQPEADAEHVRAAREGLGPEAHLMIDAGTVWKDHVERAAQCLPALTDAKVTWLEEPFESNALGAYRQLSERAAPLKLAAGEGCHQAHQAMNLIDLAGIGYVQIDTGRVGGVTSANLIAKHADLRGKTYVNHTFTSYLALAASIHPYAGLEDHVLCEYPVEASALARNITQEPILPDPSDGMIRVPEGPGLAMEIHSEALRPYLQEVEIRVNGRVLHSSARF